MLTTNSEGSCSQGSSLSRVGCMDGTNKQLIGQVW